MDTQGGTLDCRIEMYKMIIYIEGLEEELHDKKRIIKRLRKKAFFKKALKPSESIDTQPMDIDI